MRLCRSGRLGSLLPAYERAPLTYPEIGGTAGALPSGYHHLRRSAVIGHGTEALTAGSEALAGWRMHRRAGLVVVADGPAQAGRTVLLGLGRPVGLVVPCRVVDVLAEQRRRGFAYGTLPGHPECGEESFVLELDEQGRVWFTVTAFSRPGWALLRAAGALNRATQAYATGRYLKALAREITPRTP